MSFLTLPSFLSLPISRTTLSLLTLLLSLALLNIKSLPLAWHLRLSLRILRARLLPYPHHKDPFYKHKETQRCTLDDADFYGHMSNSAYAKNMDFTRYTALAKVFGKVCREQGIFPVLAATTFHYWKEIPIGHKYTASTGLLAWDQKWIYVMTKFTTVDEKTIHAIAIARLVFKRGDRKTVSPEDALKGSGYPDVAAYEVEKEAGLQVMQKWAEELDNQKKIIVP